MTTSGALLSSAGVKFLAWNENPEKGLGFTSSFFSSAAGLPSCSLVELMTGVLVNVKPPNDILLSEDEDLGVPKRGNSGALAAGEALSDCNFGGVKVKGALAVLVMDVVVTGAKENVVLAPPKMKPDVGVEETVGWTELLATSVVCAGWIEPKTNPGADTEAATVDGAELKAKPEDVEAATPNFIAVAAAATGAASGFEAAAKPNPDAAAAVAAGLPNTNPVAVGAAELSEEETEAFAGTPNLIVGKVDGFVSTTAPGLSVSQATHLIVSDELVT